MPVSRSLGKDTAANCIKCKQLELRDCVGINLCFKILTPLETHQCDFMLQ